MTSASTELLLSKFRVFGLIFFLLASHSSVYQPNDLQMTMKCAPSIIAILPILFLAPTSWSLSSQPLPIEADIRFDKWCDLSGIYRVGVQTITTSKSLGGRGLFATKPLQRGTVVASIPENLVIVAEDEVEWQVSLTTQIMALSDDNSNEWIQSWHGSGSLEMETLLPKGDDPHSVDNFVDKMIGKGNITKARAMSEVNERLNNYKRRLEQMASTEDVSKWYTLVMSRAAYLGKDWDYRVGAVPFFDMLNHCHDASKSNTELMTFGECLDRSVKDGESSNVELNRKDMLLVLTKDIDQGEELLTQYEIDVASEQTQLQLWIQYGIPPPS